jgi:hypothetical protein
MLDANERTRLLVERSWHCVPALTSTPASLEVTFLASAQGRTRYTLWLHGVSTNRQ